MTAAKLDLPEVGEPFLEVRELRKRYGDKLAVDGVSLSIPRGAIYGFLGPNGAGKTTTIRCLMDIILPDHGAMTLGGRPLVRSLRDRIGYLPEERGLYRKMTCQEQLAYLAQLKGVPRREALARAAQWLDRLELGDYAKRKVDSLSKGMQQKVQFAATFIFGPDLVILDEVFSGLDPLNIELMRDLILAERQRGTTILFSTHMLAEAERLCDAVCLIEGGVKILDGSLDSVRAAYPFQMVRVAYRDGGEPPAGLPGVSERRMEDGAWRLELAPGLDPQALLAPLAAAGSLSLFAANRPTLSEIFLVAVRRQRATRRDERSQA
ncbi:MAG TPA: ATP-binding cassette domain-containing protein [Candidatus Krumholzibacteria bacterium]|nr:ATP-binding cassette domain-containing protein [Candidatus Krumholzibacteria bacterium]HPD72662.1 ATP-binding cassette domain-containing protein [Candidatus Krumholzibacteria bacterium]HRY40406.1 ATP-binding cassette domain-containing protein [Candidatus Krumholzibacteria bacterium]